MLRNLKAHYQLQSKERLLELLKINSCVNLRVNACDYSLLLKSGRDKAIKFERSKNTYSTKDYVLCDLLRLKNLISLMPFGKTLNLPLASSINALMGKNVVCISRKNVSEFNDVT